MYALQRIIMPSHHMRMNITASPSFKPIYADKVLAHIQFILRKTCNAKKRDHFNGAPKLVKLCVLLLNENGGEYRFYLSKGTLIVDICVLHDRPTFIEVELAVANRTYFLISCCECVVVWC